MNTATKNQKDLEQLTNTISEIISSAQLIKSFKQVNIIQTRKKEDKKEFSAQLKKRV